MRKGVGVVMMQHGDSRHAGRGAQGKHGARVRRRHRTQREQVGREACVTLPLLPLNSHENESVQPQLPQVAAHASDAEVPSSSSESHRLLGF